MGKVTPFPLARPVTRATITATEADDIQRAVMDAFADCPACRGRGVFLYRRPDGLPGSAPCPCGGTDEDRIELPEGA
jgi:hypothetical protein